LSHRLGKDGSLLYRASARPPERTSPDDVRVHACFAFGSGAAGMLFKGFDIPLQVLSGEKFEQPILFGANNLSGVVQTNVAYAGRWRTLQRPRAVGRRPRWHPELSIFFVTDWRYDI